MTPRAAGANMACFRVVADAPRTHGIKNAATAFGLPPDVAEAQFETVPEG